MVNTAFTLAQVIVCCTAGPLTVPPVAADVEGEATVPAGKAASQGQGLRTMTLVIEFVEFVQDTVASTLVPTYQRVTSMDALVAWP